MCLFVHTQYTRLWCDVRPENATYNATLEVYGVAESDNATAALEAWLVQAGGVWSDAEVVEVEAEIVQDVRIVQVSGESFVYRCFFLRF